MSRVYWDTLLFVYLFEDHPGRAARLAQISEAMDRRGDTLCTSVFTLAEILGAPLEAGNAEVAARILEAMRAPRVELLPFTAAAAERCACIRAENRIALADAIHLATAAETRVERFLTHDPRLAELSIPGIGRIAGVDESDC
jgi:predicted nucleic acid-binding protein